MTVRVELLGVTRLLVDGVDQDIGGSRPRSLIAALALGGGRPSSIPDLIAAVWGDAAPPTAEGTLRVYVSRLRKLLGDALTRVAPGYALDVETDVDALRHLLRVGDVDGLSAALDGVKAPLMWGTTDTASLRRARTQLEEEVCSARRRLGSLLSAARRLEEAGDVLALTLAERPDAEQVAADLMQVRYAQGRQQEALGVYLGVREVLAERAGLEPGPVLRDLHQRILAQDPSLLQPVAPPPDGAGVAIAGRPESGRSTDGTDLPIAAVEAPGNRAAQPSPPSHGQPSSNLPLPLTTFIGRQAELAELAELLDRHRLITLTGPGGTGKTRLALETCRRRTDVDGPWLVELAGVEDARFVPAAIAEALGIGVQDGRGAEEVLLAALRGRRRCLLLIDNCEHVVEGAAVAVGAILSTCPEVSVLATSREPLAVPGERVVAVPTMPVVERTPELRLSDGDAMRLFLDRARAVVPDLTVDGPTRELVRRICADLDGLPLAVELAAAELRVFSPPELEEQLADRFTLLTGGPRTARPHQRTLQTTVAWSIELLDASQRELFADLCTFVGGFDLAAVRAVCGASAVPLLADLVDRSLVAVEGADDRGAGRRYRMLETLRQYGMTLLDDDAARQAKAAHAGWVADLVAEAGRHLRGHDGPTWERRLDLEVGNIRAGLRTMLDTDDVERALSTAVELWWWWFRRARIHEGISWLDEIVAADLPRDARLAEAHYGLAFLHFFAGSTAVEHHNDVAIEIAREIGDDVLLARLVTSKGYRWAIHGRVREGRDVLAEGLRVMGEDEPAWAAAEWWFASGQFSRLAGEAEEARARIRRALALAEASGHRWVMTVALWVLAEQALDADRPREAARLLQRALELARADADRASVLGSLRSLAGVAARLGRPMTGARLLGMVRGMSRRMGMDVDHMERADAARTTELLRTVLTSEAFTAAMAEGEGQRIGPALQLAAEILAAADEQD